MADSQSYQKIKEDFDNEAQKENGMFKKTPTEADVAIIKYLKKFIKEDWNVLEVGCGMGNVLESLNCKKTGVDLSEKMLEKCQVENKRVANMDELPFKDKEFDLTYMCFVIQQSKNPQETLKEAERVAKTVIVIDGDKESAIGKWRDEQKKKGLWETCGDAQWFCKSYFNLLGYETENLLPHVLVAKKICDV